MMALIHLLELSCFKKKKKNPAVISDTKILLKTLLWYQSLKLFTVEPKSDREKGGPPPLFVLQIFSEHSTCDDRSRETLTWIWITCCCCCCSFRGAQVRLSALIGSHTNITTTHTDHRRKEKAALWQSEAVFHLFTVTSSFHASWLNKLPWCHPFRAVVGLSHLSEDFITFLKNTRILITQPLGSLFPVIYSTFSCLLFFFISQLPDLIRSVWGWNMSCFAAVVFCSHFFHFFI